MALPFLGTPESVRLANEEARRQEEITRADTIETIRNTIGAALPVSITALTGFLTKDPVLALGAGFITDAVGNFSKRRREERRVKRLENRQRRAAADLLVESGQFQNRREALAEIERQKIQQELENAEKQKDALVEQFGLTRRQREDQDQNERGEGTPQPVTDSGGEQLALESTLTNIDDNISVIADLLLDRFADDELERSRERERRIEEERNGDDSGTPRRDEREEPDQPNPFLRMLPALGGLSMVFGGLASAVGGVASALTAFIGATGAFSLFKNALGKFRLPTGMVNPRTTTPPGSPNRVPPTVPPTTTPRTNPPTTPPTRTPSGGGALAGTARIISRVVPVVAAVATLANVADAVADAENVLELPEGVDPTVGDRVAAGIGGLVEALTFGLVNRTDVAKSIQQTGPVVEAPDPVDEFGNIERDVSVDPTASEQTTLVLVPKGDGTFDIKRVAGPQPTGAQLSEVSRELADVIGGIGSVVDASSKTQVDARSTSTTTNLQSAPLDPSNRDVQRHHPHPVYD